jgi:hypothetical protein
VAGGFLHGAAGTDEEEGKSWVGWGELLEGEDEIGVALERAETANESDERGIEGEADLVAGGVARSGLEAGRIDAVDHDVDLGGGEALLDEEIAERLGDRVDAGGAAVEETAKEEAVWRELRGGELGVLAVQDGCGEWGGEGSVEQRAEIVCVEDVRGEIADITREGGDGRGGEAFILSQDADIGGVGEALEEFAAASEAGDVDIELRGGEGGGDIDYAIFHAAGSE